MADRYVVISSGIEVSVAEGTKLPSAMFRRVGEHDARRVVDDLVYRRAPGEQGASEGDDAASGDPVVDVVELDLGRVTRDQLVEQAEALGIKVKSSMTKAQIKAEIDKRATEAVMASEAAREDVPRGVAPGTPTEAS